MKERSLDPSAPAVPPAATPVAARIALYGAASTLAGVVLSGPLALVLVARTHPQPAWRGPLAFATSYHPIQSLPYFFGFFLVAGLVLLVAGAHGLAGERQRPRATAALMLTSVYAALVALNYVVQTTFLPGLVAPYAEENGPLVAALSMANPRSLAWAIEMWGYALVGVATWLIAPVFAIGRAGTAASALLVLNGPVSLAGAAWSAGWPGWVMTPVGLAAFAGWNALLAAAAALAIAALRRPACPAWRGAAAIRPPRTAGGAPAAREARRG